MKNLSDRRRGRKNGILRLTLDRAGARLVWTAIALLLAFLWWYPALFRSSNWGEFYYQHKPWSKILSEPAAHIEPLLVFIFISIFIIMMVPAVMKVEKKTHR